MKVITVYSLKGGSGKTTISVLLAQVLKSKGFSVTLLDSDEQQKSTANWVEYSESQINCFIIKDRLTMSDLKSLNTDFVIIDGTPRTNNYVEGILELSDLIITPLQPTQLAVSSFLQEKHLSMLNSVKEKGKKIIAVINGTTQYNQKEISSIKEILKGTSIDKTETLGYRKAFVIDYEKPFTSINNSIAKNEMGYLTDTVLEILE